MILFLLKNSRGPLGFTLLLSLKFDDKIRRENLVKNSSLLLLPLQTVLSALALIDNFSGFCFTQWAKLALQTK